ncbi:MAG: tRNA (guanosine(37)-N1)-methyltransferase TrmD [Patescibacteria group bacterium]|nr:tRNA (guanosine(37)-N1)-methyltransferase TrmD [Patescibacteria group bacterium]
MNITIITLFEEMFKGPFEHSIIKRAIGKKAIKINFVNIRDFGLGRHKIVDDKPYGGGKGMVMRVDVLSKAIEKAKNKKLTSKFQKIILLDPKGKTFTQKKAQELSKLKHLVLVCGHYEGVDARIKNFIDETISIGDFILTGGEIPAMVIVDSVTRLAPFVLTGNAVAEESFSRSEKMNSRLEYPQYTRPQVYQNLKVPKLLLSGDHKKIEEWRKKASLKITLKVRPDLIKNQS